MAYIKLFFDDDDTQVSAAPTTTDAVTFTLRADLNEVGSFVKLYALADDGYTVATVVITPTGTTATKWQLDSDVGGSPSGSPENYGAHLDLGTVGHDTHVHFHIRAKAIDTETPVNDVTVTLVVTGVASAS